MKKDMGEEERGAEGLVVRGLGWVSDRVSNAQLRKPQIVRE
jgi:hypothetical protein